MDYTFTGSRIFTEKEKKTYTTLSGTKLDFTWKPAIIEKYYKEYIDAKFELAKDYPKFQAALSAPEKGKEEKATMLAYMTLLEDWKTIGYKIILAAFKANNQDYDEQFIDTQLTSEEKDLVISIIMDVHQEIFNLPTQPKKK